MSAFELGAVIVGAVIVVLMIWIMKTRRSRLVARQKSEITVGARLDASNDPEISFDKDIPDDRP